MAAGHGGLLAAVRTLLCRRIVVSGVEEDVFRLFLCYLYGGHLETETMTTETLVDLMTVADRLLWILMWIIKEWL